MNTEHVIQTQGRVSLYITFLLCFSSAGQAAFGVEELPVLSVEMGKYLQHNGKNPKPDTVGGRKGVYRNLTLSARRVRKWRRRETLRQHWGRTKLRPGWWSLFSRDLPTVTSTASVHRSSSTLAMEHRYDPPCSAVTSSICTNHNMNMTCHYHCLPLWLLSHILRACTIKKINYGCQKLHD